MNSETLVTSSGVIRNRSKPRVGIVSLNSLYCEFFDDFIVNGIDLTWESRIDELTDELRSQGKSDDEIDDAIQNDSDYWESDGGEYLIGDWVKDDTGRYSVDKNGRHGFSGHFSGDSQNISVEWSKHVKACDNTSPCYVMADGSGPCGNLDSKGDAVIAYSLPADMFRERE